VLGRAEGEPPPGQAGVEPHVPGAKVVNLGVAHTALVRVLETELELPLLGALVRVLGFPEDGMKTFGT
jgi:hypothetical protein